MENYIKHPGIHFPILRKAKTPGQKSLRQITQRKRTQGASGGGHGRTSSSQQGGVKVHM